MYFSFYAKTTLRVRYAETDKMGYCYYGNYAQYCEVGRVEAMRSAGMSYRELEEQGIMMPVMDFYVRYIAPAKYDDLIEITTYIKEIKGAKMLFDYEIHNEQKELLVQAKTTLVFVSSQSMKPIKAPVDFFSPLNKFIVKL